MDPTFLGSDVRFTADLFNERRQLPGFTRESSGGSLTLSKALAPHLTGFASYRLEQVKIEDERPYAARAPGAEPLLDRYRIGSIAAGLEYSTLDDPLAPSRGTRFGGSLEIANRGLGSEIDMRRVKAWASHHAPAGPFILHLGGTFESVTDPTLSLSGTGIPRGERLFLDGSSEVRGFAPGSIGPLDGFGMSAGGNYKLVGRAELELPLSRKLGLSLVGFGDVGTILDSSGTGSLGASAGFGILWRSPIGPLRFDWAFTPDGEKHFVFGIGSSF